ncbi:MAG: hypothetical protein ACO3B3_02555 [Cyanobium sp.]
MPFVNEVVSDDDIDRYGLGFAKGDGQYWTRDKDRDIYLWGGRSGNPAFGEEIVGGFHFYVSGTRLLIKLSIGEWSKNWNVKPFLVTWDQLLNIEPPDCAGLGRSKVIGLLKEALVVYGRNGSDNKNTPERIVRFGF